MGYAIQSIGLFPHWTVAQNIATVPQLQNGRSKIAARIDELMALLGWIRRCGRAIRISSPAVSSSALAWRGRWRPILKSC